MSIRITSAATVDRAAAEDGKQTDHPDGKVPGLALRVSPGGRKTWTLRYRDIAGKQQRVSLGTYPALTLSQARDAAWAAIGKSTTGDDPAKTKRLAKAEAKAGKVDTLNELIKRYLEAAAKGSHRTNARPKRESTLKQDRYYFQRLIQPKLGKRPYKEITRADTRAFLEKARDDHGPTAARMCGTLIRETFNFAIRRGLAETNPAALVEIPRSGKRNRVLTDDELKALWNAAEAAGEYEARVSDLMGAAIQLAMVTLQRGGEVCGARDREIDDRARTWTIPGERTKNHETHVVPLSDEAWKIIGKARRLRGNPQEGDDRLFPSPKSDNEPITRHALTRAVSRLMEKIKLSERATLHDTRRTGATNITGERIGMPRFIVSRVLNQLSDTGGAAAVTGTYDRNEYLADKRKALNAWGKLLAGIAKRS